MPDQPSIRYVTTYEADDIFEALEFAEQHGIGKCEIVSLGYRMWRCTSESPWIEDAGENCGPYIIDDVGGHYENYDG
jgi:hypothetical protein